MNKNIKQIYIGNVLEAFCEEYTEEKMPKSEADFWRRYDGLENNRSLLYGGDNKIIITPEAISPQQMERIKTIAGWKNVHNLSPNRQSDRICTDIVSNRKLYHQLTETIRNNPGLEIIQYRHTPEFYRLAEKLAADCLEAVFPEMVPENNKFIEEYFHSKRGFRHLWEQVKDKNWKIQIPEGYITGDRREAINAAWWFKQRGRDFAFKYSRGVQGIGILLNRQTDFPDNFAGFCRQTEKLLEDGIWDEPCIVVEEFIDVDINTLGGSPNVEMRVDKAGRVHREYACAQVLDGDGKTFLGVTMNPEVEANKHIKEAFVAAEAYGRKLAELGYRGVFDMDLVVSTDDKLYATEANLRRTGGTHAHEFCRNILGADYAQKHYVHLQDVSVPEDKEKAFLRVLKRWAYDGKTQIGIIPVNPEMLAVHKAPILVIAPDKQRLEEILGEINEG